LATNRNGGMLRLIAPRHDDDDDDVANHIWGDKGILGAKNKFGAAGNYATMHIVK